MRVHSSVKASFGGGVGPRIVCLDGFGPTMSRDLFGLAVEKIV